MIYSVFLAYAFSLDLVLMLAYNCIYSVIVSALFVVLCISNLLTYKRYSNSFDLWSVVWLIDNYWTVSLVIVWLIGGWSVDWRVCVCVCQRLPRFSWWLHRTLSRKSEKSLVSKVRDHFRLSALVLSLRRELIGNARRWGFTATFKAFVLVLQQCWRPEACPRSSSTVSRLEWTSWAKGLRRPLPLVLPSQYIWHMSLSLSLILCLS